MTARIDTPPKKCEREGCEEFCVRRENETSTKFRQRKYHSFECRNEVSNARIAAAAAEKRANTPSKVCAVCGNSFKRRDKEPAFRFNLRQSCDLDCAKVLRKKRSRVGMPGQAPHNAGTAKPRVRLIRYDKPRERTLNETSPPVRWLQDLELPTGGYCPTPNVPQAENLTQADRTLRRAKFREKFQEAS